MNIHMDLHIHSALSPCGDNDMSPNNILNMAYLKGLNVIAITDHNTCENVRACIAVGNKIGIMVIPGMEIQTREDIHSLCLFRNIHTALKFQKYVYEKLPKEKNKEEVFGKQILYDDMDNIVGYNHKLLLTSTNISFDEAFYKVKELNGIFIPAHIDRDSYSVISNLGFIPDYLDINVVEFANYDKLVNLTEKGIVSEKYRLIQSSDAHYLENILEANRATKYNKLNVNSFTIEQVFNALNGNIVI
jgi:PHP family Zn ribbon phosphoesterase